MTKRKLYKYVGRNGSITTPILLDDIKHIPLVEICPAEGYVLTDGIAIQKYSIIVHIDEEDNWTEIKADVIE